MRKFITIIFSFLMMQYCVMFGQSNHTVVFGGNAGDFNTAEKIYGGDNVDYYVTYDNTYMYFGAFKVNGDAFSQYHHFNIYIDSDPTSSVTSGGTGSTSGVGWDDATPTLPFQANYRICLRWANYGESFYSSYSSSWNTGGANAKGWTQYATSTALEVRVPLTDIGSPSAIYFMMYLSYGGSGFYGTNNSPTYPTTRSGSTFSGYFGGFGFRKGVIPVNSKNTPISVTGTNSTSGNFLNLTVNANTTLSAATKIVQGGSLTLSSGTLTAGSNLTIESGTLINRSEGAVTITGTSAFPTSGTLDLTYSQAGSTITAGDELTTNSGVYRDVTINSTNGVTINKDPIFCNNSGTLSLTAGTLTIGSSNTLNLYGGATLAVTSGSLGSTGKISFNGSGTVTGTVAFNNVDISGGVNFGSNSTINGILKINNNSYVSSAGLIYGSSSTLQYYSGTTYGRSLEWSATTGGGYPANVQISNNTTLNLGNGGTSTARQCAGNLTIDNGSALSMNVSAMSASLTVLGNIINNGTLTLSATSGGDLKIRGDFTNNTGSTFNGNKRAVFFIGSDGAVQNINGTKTSVSIPYIVLAPASGAVTVNQLMSVTVSADDGGNAIDFGSNSSNLYNFSGYDLTLSKGRLTNTIYGKLNCNSSSSLTLNGSTETDTLRFSPSSATLKNFTIGRSGGSTTLINTLTLASDGVLTLNAGKLIAGDFTLNLLNTSSSAVVGGSSTSYVVLKTSQPVDVSMGNITKSWASTGSFTYPVGSTSGYTPITVNITSGTFSSATLRVRIVTSTHTQNPNTTNNYLKYCWVFTPSGITGYSANIAATYLTGDVTGTESLLNGAVYSTSSAAWTMLSGVNTTTHQFSGTVTDLGQVTAGALTSVANGTWSSPDTWDWNAVPGTGASATVNNDVVLDNSSTEVNVITINSTKSLNLDGNTLIVQNGGSLVNNGTFTPTNGTVTFAGSGTVTGTIGFYNLTIAGAVNPGTASTINGILRINTGGSILTNAPTYASGSTLLYAAGGTVSRATEWNSGTGPGYPANIQLSGNTTLDISSGATGARKLSGNLTIDSGSKLFMNAMTDSLAIYGNLTNNGTLELSSAVGGDLRIKGNFTNAGTFTTHTREIVFAGSSLQTFNSSSTASLEYVAIDNQAGVTLGSVPSSEFQITNRLRFVTGSGSFNTGANTLVLGSSLTALAESAGSYIVGNVRMTKTVGTNSETFANLGISIPAGTENLGDVTVYRYSGSGAAVTAGSFSGINRKWRLTNTGTKKFSSRNITFSWVSSDDNGKNLANAQAYASSNSGSSWYSVGSTQNASTRSITVATDTLHWFTVSDDSNPLISAFTLTANALVEALWNGTTTTQDTMTVEIRTAASPYTLVASGKAYSTTTGGLSFSLSGVQNSTSYYLVIKHRNALAVWSSNPITFSGSAASYDFTTGAAQAYGSNMILKSTKYCLYSGDVNGDGAIDFTDLKLVDNAANSSVTGYVATDIDGSNAVNYTDLRLCDANVVRHLTVKSPSVSKEAAKPANSENSGEQQPQK